MTILRGRWPTILAERFNRSRRTNLLGSRWLSIAVSLVVIAIALSVTDLSRVVGVVLAADRSLTLAALVGLFVSWIIHSIKLKLILGGVGISSRLSTLLRVNLATSLYAFVLPGQLPSEVAKAVRLAEPGVSRVRITTALVADRLSGLVGLVIVGSVAGILSPPIDSRIEQVLGLIAVGTVGLAAALLAGWRGLRFSTRFAWLTERLVPGTIRSVWTTFPKRRSWTLVVLSISIAVVGQTTIVLAGWLVTLALGLSLSPLTLGWMHLVIALVGIVPVGFAGISLREGASVALLTLYGVPVGDAIAVSILHSSLELVLALFGRLLDLLVLVGRDTARAAMPPS